MNTTPGEQTEGQGNKVEITTSNETINLFGKNINIQTVRDSNYGILNLNAELPEGIGHAKYNLETGIYRVGVLNIEIKGSGRDNDKVIVTMEDAQVLSELHKDIIRRVTNEGNSLPPSAIAALAIFRGEGFKVGMNPSVMSSQTEINTNGAVRKGVTVAIVPNGFAGQVITKLVSWVSLFARNIRSFNMDQEPVAREFFKSRVEKLKYEGEVI